MVFAQNCLTKEPFDRVVHAQKVISAIQKAHLDDNSLNAMLSYSEIDILKQAKESTQRFTNGNPLGVFDGVPIAVKDELDQRMSTYHDFLTF